MSFHLVISLALVLLACAHPILGADTTSFPETNTTTNGTQTFETTSSPSTPTANNNSSSNSSQPTLSPTTQVAGTTAPTVPTNEQAAYKQLSDLADHIQFLVGVTTALDQRSADQLNELFNSPVVSLFLGAARGYPFTDLQKVQVLNSLKVLKTAYDLDRRITSVKTSYFDSLSKLEFVFDRQCTRFLASIAKVDVDSGAAMNITSVFNVTQSPLLVELNLQYKSYLFAIGRVVYISQLVQKLQANNALARQLPAGVMGAVRTGNNGFQSVTYAANSVTDLKLTDIILEPLSNAPIQAPQVYYYRLKRR